MPQEGEFLRSSNQRRQAGFKRHLEPALRAFFPHDLVDRDGSRLAFQRVRSERLALKKSLDESIDCGAHYDRICLGNSLEARRNIRSLTERELLVPFAGTHVAHHDLSGVNTDPQTKPWRVFCPRTERL